MSKYVTYQGNWCLTSCIYNILKSRNLNINESDLICTNNFLRLQCKTKFSALSADIFKMVKEMGQEHNILITEIQKILSIQQIYDYIKKGEIILLHINSKELEYSKLFQNNNADLSNHFINLLDAKDGKFYVSDGFIPNNISTKFEGWIYLKEEIIFNSKTYLVNSDNYISMDETKIKKLVTDSLIDALHMNDIAFDKFIDNLQKQMQKEYAERTILVDMAAEIAVEGASLAKIFLQDILCNYGIIHNITEIRRKLAEIVKQYIIIRMFLLKSYYSEDNHNLLRAIRLVEELKKNEKEVLSWIIEFLK